MDPISEQRYRSQANLIKDELFDFETLTMEQKNGRERNKREQALTARVVNPLPRAAVVNEVAMAVVSSGEESHPEASPGEDEDRGIAYGGSSGDSDEVIESDDDEALSCFDEASGADGSAGSVTKVKNENADNLYSGDMDGEDEAWVYKHLRGGTEEIVNVRRRTIAKGKAHCAKSKSNSGESAGSFHSKVDDDWMYDAEQIRVLKPRNSDAILSCPCCFTTVCMDCQQHERYKNQYRAMFVMNIGVHWDIQLVFDARAKVLKPRPANNECASEHVANNTIGSEASLPDMVPDDGAHKRETDNLDDEYFYSVYCLECKTEVAALNMEDEVYHFFGCLASG